MAVPLTAVAAAMLPWPRPPATSATCVGHHGGNGASGGRPQVHGRKPSLPSLRVQIFSSALGDLAILLLSSFKDMPATKLHFPGMPPIRALDMGVTMRDWNSDIAKARLSQCTHMLEARDIVVKSFDWLEARVLEALSRGLCTPGRSALPVHCIGPPMANTNAPTSSLAYILSHLASRQRREAEVGASAFAMPLASAPSWWRPAMRSC